MNTNCLNYKALLLQSFFFRQRVEPEANMSKLLEKPTPPSDDDCCGSGSCNPCVWDAYNAKMHRWRIKQAKLREQQKPSPPT